MLVNNGQKNTWVQNWNLTQTHSVEEIDKKTSSQRKVVLVASVILCVLTIGCIIGGTLLTVGKVHFPAHVPEGLTPGNTLFAGAALTTLTLISVHVSYYYCIQGHKHEKGEIEQKKWVPEFLEAQRVENDHQRIIKDLQEMDEPDFNQFISALNESIEEDNPDMRLVELAQIAVEKRFLIFFKRSATAHLKKPFIDAIKKELKSKKVSVTELQLLFNGDARFADLYLNAFMEVGRSPELSARYVILQHLPLLPEPKKALNQLVLQKLITAEDFKTVEIYYDMLKLSDEEPEKFPSLPEVIFQFLNGDLKYLKIYRMAFMHYGMAADEKYLSLKSGALNPDAKKLLHEALSKDIPNIKDLKTIELYYDFLKTITQHTEDTRDVCVRFIVLLAQNGTEEWIKNVDEKVVMELIHFINQCLKGDGPHVDYQNCLLAIIVLVNRADVLTKMDVSTLEAPFPVYIAKKNYALGNKTK